MYVCLPAREVQSRGRVRVEYLGIHRGRQRRAEEVGQSLHAIRRQGSAREAGGPFANLVAGDFSERHIAPLRLEVLTAGALLPSESAWRHGSSGPPLFAPRAPRPGTRVRVAPACRVGLLLC